MIDKKTIKDLEELNKRLQKIGFSWQHSDYFLLRKALPLLLMFFAMNPVPPCAGVKQG